MIWIPLVAILVAACTSIGIYVKSPGRWEPPIVLEAPSEDGDKATLIYMPGAQVPAKFYTPLCKEIQYQMEASNVSLTCVLVNYPIYFGLQIPAVSNIETMITYVLEFLPKELSQGAPLFLGGHSVGAVCAQWISMKKETLYDYKAAVLHGAFIMDKYRSELPPIPMLSLSGTRDGMNRLPVLAHQYQDYKDMPGYLEQSPTILIEGMNHMQFADNYSNSYTSKKDLQPTISLKESLSSAAYYSKLFMLQILDTKVRLDPFLQAVETAETKYLKPFFDVYEADRQGETCVEAQKLIFGKEASKRSIQSMPAETSWWRFAFAPTHSDESEVRVRALVRRAFQVFGRSSVPQSYETLSCKLLTAEHVFGSESEYTSCTEMNAIIFEQVLSSLPDKFHSDYVDAPNKFILQGDADYHFFMTWVASRLKMERRENGTIVEFPHFKSPKSMYCAMMPRSRALEHVLIDGFRTIPSSADEENTEL